MDWIKQNIVLVASLAVSLALIGGAGYFFYSKIGQEGELNTQLAAAQATYSELIGKTPFPSAENVEMLKQQQTNLLTMRARIEKQFPVLPTNSTLRSADFNVMVAGVIDELKASAVAANVGLPTNNTLFAFTAQRGMLQFDSNALPIMAVQLGDVKTISHILFDSKVYEIFSFKRVALPSDNAAKGTYPQDYLPPSRTVTTNALTGAVVYPYEVAFKGVTAELAAVLDKMAKSPAGILVKAITVVPIEEGEAVDAGTGMAASATAMVNLGGGRRMSRQMAQRYGFTRRAGPPTAATPQMAINAADLAAEMAKKASQLKERPFKATIYLEMVKLQPLKKETAPTPRASAARGAADNTSTPSN